jgi:hypothetical protein
MVQYDAINSGGRRYVESYITWCNISQSFKSWRISLSLGILHHMEHSRRNGWCNAAAFVVWLAEVCSLGIHRGLIANQTSAGCTLHHGSILASHHVTLCRAKSRFRIINQTRCRSAFLFQGTRTKVLEGSRHMEADWHHAAFYTQQIYTNVPNKC